MKDNNQNINAVINYISQSKVIPMADGLPILQLLEASRTTIQPQQPTEEN